MKPGSLLITYKSHVSPHYIGADNMKGHTSVVSVSAQLIMNCM